MKIRPLVNIIKSIGKSFLNERNVIHKGKPKIEVIARSKNVFFLKEIRISVLILKEKLLKYQILYNIYIWNNKFFSKKEVELS